MKVTEPGYRCIVWGLGIVVSGDVSGDVSGHVFRIL